MMGLTVDDELMCLSCRSFSGFKVFDVVERVESGSSESGRVGGPQSRRANALPATSEKLKIEDSLGY